jgi:hypothetical protein
MDIQYWQLEKHFCMLEALKITSIIVHVSRSSQGLKEQCHKIVAEIRPWSGRLGLN